MNPRTPRIAALALIGAAAGPFALRDLSFGRPGLGWSIYMLLFIGCALGLPWLLAWMGGSGRYQAMVRLWSVLGALAVVLASAGALAVATSGAGTGASPASWLALALGAGVLAGLALVKLMIRRGRAQSGS